MSQGLFFARFSVTLDLSAGGEKIKFRESDRGTQSFKMLSNKLCQTYQNREAPAATTQPTCIKIGSSYVIKCKKNSTETNKTHGMSLDGTTLVTSDIDTNTTNSSSKMWRSTDPQCFCKNRKNVWIYLLSSKAGPFFIFMMIFGMEKNRKPILYMFWKKKKTLWWTQPRMGPSLSFISSATDAPDLLPAQLPLLIAFIMRFYCILVTWLWNLGGLIGIQYCNIGTRAPICFSQTSAAQQRFGVPRGSAQSRILARFSHPAAHVDGKRLNLNGVNLARTQSNLCLINPTGATRRKLRSLIHKNTSQFVRLLIG